MTRRASKHGLHGMHGAFACAVAGIVLSAMFARGTPAAEPATIPTADFAAPRCTVGQPCTFAAPIFACDYANAEKIAAAGPSQGRAMASARVSETACRIVSPGRPLATEATKSAQVIYLTRDGQHLGYLPVGVFAPGGIGPRAACDKPGFCAVKPGAQVLLCPEAASLNLPTAEAKALAKCLRIGDSNSAQVSDVTATTVALSNMFGGKLPFASTYYGARDDFVALNLQPIPTPPGRGWCAPGSWCVTTANTLFCSDRAAYERLHAFPFGEPFRVAAQREPGCRIIFAGSILKPNEVPATDNTSKLIPVEHPALAAGWASAEAFPIVALSPPLRYTARLGDLTVAPARVPALAAIALAGQGTTAASGTFRTGSPERREFCSRFSTREEVRDCLSQPNPATVTARANCEAKQIGIDDRRYALLERPRDAPPDIHEDRIRRWIYRDLKRGEWLSGAGMSGEGEVSSAFDALCPGVDPEASSGLVYRDPRAQYPRELQGRWFADRKACADPKHDDPDYDEYVWMQIADDIVNGYHGSEDRPNAVRELGHGRWAIDEEGRSQEDTPTFETTIYAPTRAGITTTVAGKTAQWSRCP